VIFLWGVASLFSVFGVSMPKGEKLFYLGFALGWVLVVVFAFHFRELYLCDWSFG
jgi:hypothetical protein